MVGLRERGREGRKFGYLLNDCICEIKIFKITNLKEKIDISINYDFRAPLIIYRTMKQKNNREIEELNYLPAY